MMKTVRIFLFFVAAGFSVQAQDPGFSQYYGNPIYLNPAFAGSTKCPRLIMNYRNQWPAIKSTFITMAASYDQYVDALRGGVALQVMNDRAGQGAVNTTTVSGVYSYQLNISKSVAAKLGLEGSYGRTSFDYQSFVFGDQFDDRQGNVFNSQENIEKLKDPKSNFDAGAGLLVYSASVYGGFSVNHLLQPSQAYLTSVNASQHKLPIKYTAHFGFIHVLGKDKRTSTTYISPNVLYQQQGNFNYLNLGMYYGRGPLVTGVWYRGKVGDTESGIGNDALILLLGLQSGMFKFGYSYDITVSRLSSSGGAHELSLGIQFPCSPKKKKFRAIKCPTF